MRAALLMNPRGSLNRHGRHSPEFCESTGRRRFGRRDEGDAAEETMLAGRSRLASHRGVIAQYVGAMGRRRRHSGVGTVRYADQARNARARDEKRDHGGEERKVGLHCAHRIQFVAI